MSSSGVPVEQFTRGSTDPSRRPSADKPSVSIGAGQQLRPLRQMETSRVRMGIEEGGPSGVSQRDDLDHQLRRPPLPVSTTYLVRFHIPALALSADCLRGIKGMALNSSRPLNVLDYFRVPYQLFSDQEALLTSDEGTGLGRLVPADGGGGALYWPDLSKNALSTRALPPRVVRLDSLTISARVLPTD